MDTAVYHSKYKIRFVTAASLFDGHDATINIMRRILQSSGTEVIHLGHNRSALEVVECAIQEDVQGIAVTSYQGGHMEYFKYMYDLLHERGAGNIKIFGGGGGVILPHEVKELHEYGIARIYSPDDGREMGLQGMINDMLRKCDHPTRTQLNGELKHLKDKDSLSIGAMITMTEAPPSKSPSSAAGETFKASLFKALPPIGGEGLGGACTLGITGTGGAGKSTVVDE